MDLAIRPEDMLAIFKDRVTCRAIDYNVDGLEEYKTYDEIYY